MRLVEKLRRIAAPPPAAPPVVRRDIALAGERVDGYRIRRERIALHRCHGQDPVGESAATRLAPLAGIARDDALSGYRVSDALYFDTETTSLGGGVGTWVFLLGAGWFEDDAFVVEQYFLDDVTGEAALLEAVRRLFARFPLAVSFHGKGFDTPRLQGRHLFHGIPWSFPDAHLDLCIVGRSLYRGAFSDCRLQTFERELLGHVREDDLPGAECPQAFFRHLQGDSTTIPRVFEHNLLDILTLPLVAARFSGAMTSPDHPVLLSNLGRFFERSGQDAKARAAYARALQEFAESAAGSRQANGHGTGCVTNGRARDVLARSLERLALLERRAGRHAASADLLKRRIELPPYAFQPLEDLAKYHEHRARDLVAAQATAIEARSRLVTGRIEADRVARERYLGAIDHRLARLERRLTESGASPLSRGHADFVAER